MFSTLSETNFNFSVTFILSSANALNLDQYKVLLLVKELNLLLVTVVWSVCPSYLETLPLDFSK